MTLAYIRGLDYIMALVLRFNYLPRCWTSFHPHYVVMIFRIITRWPQLHFSFWHIHLSDGSNWLPVLYGWTQSWFLKFCEYMSSYFLAAGMFVNVKHYFSRWSYPAFSDVGIYIWLILAVKACRSQYFQLLLMGDLTSLFSFAVLMHMNVWLPDAFHSNYL